MSFDAHPASAPTPSTGSSVGASSAPSTPAPSAPSDPTPSSPAPAQPMPAAASAEGQAPSPYTPNLKFKFLDKEQEFDPMFSSVIKDEVSEKKVRELYEKAYGLDHVKGKYTNLQTRYQQAEQFIGQVLPKINEMQEAYSRKDLDSIFKTLNIPEEMVLQHIIAKAQYMELPPEQRKVLDEKRYAEQKALQLEKQVSSYQQQVEAQVTQAKSFALQVTLEKPDYKAISQAFDARAGKPGAFRDAIIDAGELAWIRSNGQIDLTPEQAIQQVIQYWGNPLQQMAQNPPVIPVQQTQAQAPQGPPAKRTTIPNVASRSSASVGKSKPKSLDDLKKLAAQMSA